MKQMFLALSLLMLGVSSQAQVSYGAKAGLNLSTITGKDVNGYQTKTGFHFGGFASIPLASKFSLQPEAIYSTEGARWEKSGKTLLGYLRIPVLASYSTGAGLSVATGPQLGFLMSAKDEYEKESEDIKEYLETVDLSWAFNLGYQLNGKLGVYGRYNLGLTKFYEEEKNSVIQFGVQYRFGK